MLGRLRGEARVQRQRDLTFRKKVWKGGECSDSPASEIGENEVAILENAIAFPEYVEGRSGSQRISDAALPGSGMVWALHQHKATRKCILHRGSEVYTAAAAMASWTLVREYAHRAEVGGAVVAGDASAQLSNLFLVGAAAGNTNSGEVYWNLTDAAGTRTLSLYRTNGSPKTNLVATGSRAGDGTIQLRQQNGSILYGVVNVAYLGDDTDTSNIITLAYNSALSVSGMVDNRQSCIRDFGGHVVLAAGTDSDSLVLINLTDDRAYPLNTYCPVAAIPGSGTQSASAPYGYRYLYTFSRISTATGTRIDSELIQETGSNRPSPLGSDIPIDYGEFWLANPISGSNAHTLTFNTYSTLFNIVPIQMGHYTHISLYRTLDIGAAGVDPVTGQGNNTEIYVWVGDYPIGSGDISVTKTDDTLRAGFAKGFGLKSRFFEPISRSNVLEVEPNFIMAMERGTPTVRYSQIAGDYKVYAGFHRRDIQFQKLDDGGQAIIAADGITTIICGDRTYLSSPNAYFNAEVIESVFVRNHLTLASENIGVRDWGSIAAIDSGRFVAHCSDHSIRVWNGSSWGEDLSAERVNKIVRQMVTGSVGGFADGAYLLWYRTDSGQTYNNKGLRFGFGRSAGYGWSRMTGDAWVYPPVSVGCLLAHDGNTVKRLIVLDSPGAAFYWIETFDSYTGSGLSKVYTDKVTTAGVAGTAIVGKVRLREYVGPEENATLYHQETFASLRASAAAGFPAGFSSSMLGYADGVATPVETVSELIRDGDWQFWSKVEGKRIQLEFNFATSGWQMTKVKSLVQAQDKASIGKGPSSTPEASSQAALAGTGLKHWLTRPKNLLNRATGRSYTLTGTAPTNVTGPDGKSYALSFVTGASYSIADTTSYSDFSLILWIKGVTAGNRLLVITGTDSFYLTLTNNTTLDVNGAGNVTLTTVASGWHQIVAVRSGTTVSIYQNGALRGLVTVATARGGTSVTLNPDAVAMILAEFRLLTSVLAMADVLYNYTDINTNSGAKVLPLV